jgi:exodeoxyribonuclease VIII
MPLFGIGTPCPKPGIYYDMQAEEYHAVDAMSKSRLDALHRSPAFLKSYLLQEHEDTPATLLGSLVHLLAMEPHKFEGLYDVFENTRRNTKEGKENCELSENHKRTPVSREIHEKASAMAKSLREHPEIGGVFYGGGTSFEVSVFWEVSLDCGVVIPCKARIDILNYDFPGFGTLVADIKTCRDARAHAMSKAMLEHRYHVQAAWYRNGLYRADELATKQFTLLCVENEAPYHAKGYNVSEASQVSALREIKADMELLGDCILKDEWPGYTEGIDELELPKWARDKEE